MSKLVFKASEVTRISEHAILTEGQVLLVRDQGIYLMSNGKPLDKVEGDSSYVVYALGCNPNTDAEWYDTASDLVGGDDFAEALPFAEAINDQIENGADEITIIVTNNSIKLGKPKVSTLRKCSKCDRLLKKQDVGDICPNCQEESSLIEAPTQTGSEAIHITPVFTEEDKNEPSEPLNSEPSEPAVEELKVKPGQAMRDMFAKLVQDGKVTDNVLSILTDAEATKRELGIRYAFLKKFNPETPIKELTYVGTHARYSSKPIDVNGKQYLMTNDLYKKNIDKFTEWVKLFY